MNLFEFFFSLIFVVVLLKIYALSLRINRTARPGRRVAREVNGAGVSTESAMLVGAAPPAGGDMEWNPCLTEAILVARRLAGDLAPADYRRAMAELAAQDANSHHVAVPRDTDA